MERTRFIIEFADQVVVDEIKKLPRSVQIMIRNAIKERLETCPLSYGKPLRYSLNGHRSLRVSNYRIIYKVENHIVVIIKSDIRRDVYN